MTSHCRLNLANAVKSGTVVYEKFIASIMHASVFEPNLKQLYKHQIISFITIQVVLKFLYLFVLVAIIYPKNFLKHS